MKLEDSLKIFLELWKELVNQNMINVLLFQLQASLKEMMLPGLLTIGFPLLITVLPMLFGMDNQIIAEMLGGYMAGVTVSGVLWAIFPKQRWWCLG